jgi:hypothetical protein
MVDLKLCLKIFSILNDRSPSAKDTGIKIKYTKQNAYRWEMGCRALKYIWFRRFKELPGLKRDDSRSKSRISSRRSFGPGVFFYISEVELCEFASSFFLEESSSAGRQRNEDREVKVFTTIDVY